MVSPYSQFFVREPDKTPFFLTSRHSHHLGQDATSTDARSHTAVSR